MSTDTVPQTEHPRYHTSGATLAASLHALADRIAGLGNTVAILPSITFQITAHSDAAQDQRAATIDAFATVLGTPTAYSPSIGHYRSELRPVDGIDAYAFGQMDLPDSVFSQMWDGAHTEDRDRKVAAETAAADRLQGWFDTHRSCCRDAGYRAAMDHEQEVTEAWRDAELNAAAIETAAQELAAVTGDETTCGRCLIDTGAHTFGRGCKARLEPVFIDPAPIADCERCNAVTPGSVHTEVGDCRYAVRAERPELIHIVDPAGVAPGEPDDRGWDAPIVPVFVDQLGASA